MPKTKAGEPSLKTTAAGMNLCQAFQQRPVAHATYMLAKIKFYYNKNPYNIIINYVEKHIATKLAIALSLSVAFMAASMQLANAKDVKSS